MNVNDFRSLMRYNDWANDAILKAAATLDAAKLERAFEMGMGTLRRTLIHIYNGEYVWLNRWQARTETKWPPENVPTPVSDIMGQFSTMRRDRDAFLAKLSDAEANKIVIYRDSKGSQYQATLANMLMQAFVHSTHHRAQAVNMLRQLGAGLVEVDYMMSLRQPVATIA